MIKNIVINNDKKLNKFYNKLWLYKFFRFTEFKITTNIKDEQIKMIEKALNIKSRRKRIEYIHDSCCEYIDNKNKGINICGFKNRRCYVQQCINKYQDGCCRKCRYITPKGCSSKNLSCKLFNCSQVKSRYEVVKFKDLKILKLYSLKNRFLIKSDFFSKREQVLKDLYTYTLACATIRMISRIIINCLRKKR